MKPGTLIGGKYRLSRQLGSGAMGVVWAAVNERLAREVAVKLVSQPGEALRVRMLREARACGMLKHPNIVEVLDVDQTPEGDPYLVMELLSGETLGDMLERVRRLETAPAARIARDVARALGAAHAAGIVHRDLKPANIFLSEELAAGDVPLQVVKVLDFGVSKNLLGEAGDDLATQTGDMVGSPAYMSPEQVQARRDVDYRSDLWALGVVLFQMLTGRRPFQGETAQILMAIVHEPAPPVSRFVRNADPGLARLVARCLERDRERRVQSASELVELLYPFCEGLPGPAERAPSAPVLPQREPDEEELIPTRLNPDTIATHGRLGPAFGVPRGAPPPTEPESATVPLQGVARVARDAATRTLPLPNDAVAPPSSGPPPQRTPIGKRTLKMLGDEPVPSPCSPAASAGREPRSVVAGPASTREPAPASVPASSARSTARIVVMAGAVTFATVILTLVLLGRVSGSTSGSTTPVESSQGPSPSSVPTATETPTMLASGVPQAEALSASARTSVRAPPAASASTGRAAPEARPIATATASASSRALPPLRDDPYADIKTERRPAASGTPKGAPAPGKPP